MSSRPENKKACSAPRESRNQPCDNRPRSGPAAAKQRTPRNTDAIRADLPDEPPTLTPEAARALLRILIKAFDRLNGTGNPKEPLNDQVRVLRPGIDRGPAGPRILAVMAAHPLARPHRGARRAITTEFFDVDKSRPTPAPSTWYDGSSPST
jgi:hypothetical protein